MKTRRLKNINVHEVAFVDRAANKRRFFLIKREESMKHAFRTHEPSAVKEEVTVLKLEKEKTQMETLMETLKGCIALLEGNPGEEGLKKCIEALKALVAQAPDSYAAPDMAKNIEAFEKALMEKACAKAGEAKKAKVVEAMKGLKDALALDDAYVAKRETPAHEEVSAEEAAQVISQELGKVLEEVLA